ncbi:LOW QUALITY PROTEIN: hypothetical protein RvY_09419-2 [Ramazzottius varieornatus]|uniref:Helicase ATP-binding domain-containing protein n=1 Tax=Ramazzottius varieornatus TaxID=947166 RepID=A0A1D1VBQ2_RAMVA|nr:LOW QUALITY PROTEIN: hypothetical protein RvY_09419-2 [Ramazzottius varieornatus]
MSLVTNFEFYPSLHFGESDDNESREIGAVAETHLGLPAVEVKLSCEMSLPKHGSSSRRRHRESSQDDRSRIRHRKDKRRESTDRVAGSPSAQATGENIWDGILSSFDDVRVPIRFDWDAHKRNIMKIMFGRGGIIEGDNRLRDDFWSFFKKLLENCGRLAERNGNARNCVIKNATSRFHLTPRNFNIVHRYQFVRGDDEYSLEIPPDGLKTLHYAALCYVDFLEKQEFQKYQKLRAAQANLPISNYRGKILELIQANSIVIVSGDTGCGKSTQVPQYLLKAGFENVCCTQPRRIACISLSKRVAFETLNEYGSQVAYQIRFEKTTTSQTKIVFMTEGLLLRQIGSDSVLDKYNVIVLDEVHERHLHSDFLLGIVRSLISQRPDLRIVLMSATINIELFARYFDNAPVVQVPGRLFPIQVNYKPISHEARSSSRFNPAPYVRILEMIDNKYPSSERGDVLIFLR